MTRLKLSHIPAAERLSVAEITRPLDDPATAAEIGQLPQEQRHLVLAWLDVLRPVVTGPRAGRGARVAAAAAAMGVSAKTARRKYDDLIQEGWRALVNKRQTGRTPASQDIDCTDRTAFSNWIKGLAENYGGNLRHARRAALATWKAARTSGATIPGYAAWPLPTAAGYPRGWSYGNLSRLCKLTPYERKLSSVGRAAARQHAPMVIRTRAGLHVGEVKMADDLWHDVDCHLLGTNQREFVRFMELSILDVFSAHKETWGGKFRLRDEATGKRINLRGRDMRFLIAHDFCNVGYYPARCLFFVEHGTAAVEDRVAEILHRYSGGKIQIKTSGIQDKPALLGSWAGAQRGNPRFKAAIESSHRLIHNAARYLPGQTGGSSRENLPEDHHGRERAWREIVRAFDRAAALMSQERLQWLANELQAPVMAAQSYAQIVYELYEIIANFTDHQLEGWEDAGLFVSGFRPQITSTDFFDYNSLNNLPPDQAAAVRTILSANPQLNVSRRMSRLEAFNSGRRLLRRLPVQAFVEICGEDLAVERKVKNHAITFQDADVRRGHTFRFPAIALDQRGHEILLKENETYQTLLNPFDPSRLFVLDARFSLVGTLSEQIVVSHADMEAAHVAMGQAAHAEKLAMLPYRMRHADRQGEAERTRRHNAALLDGFTKTPEESALQRIAASTTTADVDELAAALLPPTPTAETIEATPDLSDFF